MREFDFANERHPEHWRVRRRLGSGPDDCAAPGEPGTPGEPQDRKKYMGE